MLFLTWDLCLPFPLSYSFVHFSKSMACLLIKFCKVSSSLLIKFCKVSSIQKVPEFTIVDFRGPQLTTLDLENVVPHGEFWTPWGHDPQASKNLTGQLALVGVMPNIWPGFVDQVVNKWVTEKNEWMVVLQVQRGLVPPGPPPPPPKFCKAKYGD